MIALESNVMKKSNWMFPNFFILFIRKIPCSVLYFYSTPLFISLHWYYTNTYIGKHLLRGETDGSSFPNGGLRVTHSAAAYLTIDPTSPVFLRGDVIFIPGEYVWMYIMVLFIRVNISISIISLNVEMIVLKDFIIVKLSLYSYFIWFPHVTNLFTYDIFYNIIFTSYHSLYGILLWSCVGWKNAAIASYWCIITRSC